MDHQFAFAYSPLQQKDNWNFSYITKPSKRLQLFTEFKCASLLDGTAGTEFLGGFKLKFAEAAITGYMTSNYKCFGIYSKNMEGGQMKLDFNTILDFNNQRKPCVFGVSLNAGMM